LQDEQQVHLPQRVAPALLGTLDGLRLLAWHSHVPPLDVERNTGARLSAGVLSAWRATLQHLNRWETAWRDGLHPVRRRTCTWATCARHCWRGSSRAATGSTSWSGSRTST